MLGILDNLLPLAEKIAALGNRFAGPGIGHGDGEAVDVVQRRGAVRKVMVMGIES